MSGEDLIHAIRMLRESGKTDAEIATRLHVSPGLVLYALDNDSVPNGQVPELWRQPTRSERSER